MQAEIQERRTMIGGSYLSFREIREMRSWAIDNVFAELSERDQKKLTDRQIVEAVSANWRGGVAGFLMA